MGLFKTALQRPALTGGLPGCFRANWRAVWLRKGAVFCTELDRKAGNALAVAAVCERPQNGRAEAVVLASCVHTDKLVRAALFDYRE